MEIINTKENELPEISKIFIAEKQKKPYSQKLTKKESLDKLTGFFKKDDMYTLKIDKIIIGFCVCEKRESKKEIYLSELWIDEKYHGKGYGKQIMNFIENKYKSKFKTITLVADKNANASKFYEKLGYKVKNVWLKMDKRIR